MKSDLLLPVILVALLGASACGGDQPPARSSATPVQTGTLTASIVDHWRDEPTWYDTKTDRVMWIRDGRVAMVQDVGVNAYAPEPTSLAVFDDGSFVVTVYDTVARFPVGGPPSAVKHDGEQFVSVFGNSLSQFWSLGYDEHGQMRLCSASATSDEDGCDAVSDDETTGVADAMGVTVYFGDWNYEPTCTRLRNGQLDPLVSTSGVALKDVQPIRKTQGTLWATDLATWTLYDVSDTVVTSHQATVIAAFGTPDEYVYAQLDVDQHINATCISLPNGGLSLTGDSACSTFNEPWTQTVYYRSVKGQVTEIGHENCVPNRDGSGCNGNILTMGVQNGTLFIVGPTTIRSLSE